MRVFLGGGRVLKCPTRCSVHDSQNGTEKATYFPPPSPLFHVLKLFNNPPKYRRKENYLQFPSHCQLKSSPLALHGIFRHISQEGKRAVRNMSMHNDLPSFLEIQYIYIYVIYFYFF